MTKPAKMIVTSFRGAISLSCGCITCGVAPDFDRRPHQSAKPEWLIIQTTCYSTPPETAKKLLPTHVSPSMSSCDNG
jgi:hypothetical protein